MLRRLAIGCVKGLVIGLGLGLLFQGGLRWAPTTELLAYLLSMGAGATVGVLAGRPPWRQDSWLESLLKLVAGVGVGAMLYWAVDTYLPFELPFSALGAPAGISWTELPVFYLPPIAALFGAMVELDNTPGPSAPAKPPRAPKSSNAGSDGDIDWGS